MLSLPSNLGWILLLVVIAIVGFILLNKKYPITKTIVLIVAIFATGAGAVYCGINTYAYISASGSVIGVITGNYEKPTVEVKELKFTIQNMELRPTANEDEYSAKLTVYQGLVMEMGEEYGLFLNGEPCTYTIVAGDHVNAKFDYTFYNQQDSVLHNDELYIYLAVNENYTTIEIVSKGGSDSIKYWHSYFGKNNCVLEFKPVDKKLDDSGINYGDGNVAHAIAKFYYKEELILTKVYHPGTEVEFPVCNDLYFSGWATSADGGESFYEYVINENTDFYAQLNRVYTDEEFIALAYADMKSGILDLSEYPIKKIPTARFSGYSHITKVILPETLTEIGGGAFESTGLTEITLPDSLVTIGNAAFARTNLKTVTFSENSSLKNISYGAFAYCTKLTSITLPKTVQTVGYNSNDFYIYKDDIEDLEIVTEVFYGCDLTITCLFASDDADLSENWNYNGTKLLEVVFSDSSTNENPGQGDKEDITPRP